MRIYGIQTNLEWEDKDANFARIRSLLGNENIQPESLIVLPETFSTGFSMNLKVTTENEPQQTESFLSGLAKDRKCWVTGGLIEPTIGGQKGSNRPSSRYVQAGRCIHSTVRKEAGCGHNTIEGENDGFKVCE